MLIEILIAISLGITVGTISGLTPGLHLNLVSIIAATILPTYNIPIILIFTGVMSMAITHTITDILASTYLGVPNENNIATLLPAQKLVLEGKAHQAVFFTIFGSVLSVFATIPLIALIFTTLPGIETTITPILGFILISVLLFLIYNEKNKLLCISIFLLAGALGTATLSWSILKQPLLPLLGGLFGGAGLIELIRNKIQIPKQKPTKIETTGNWLSILGSTITGILAAFLPGIGSSQAGIIAGRIMANRRLESQLIVAGGINTVNMVFSIATWIMLDKARNGAVASLATLAPPTTLSAIILLAVCCLVAPLAGLLALFLSTRICKLFEKINYRYLSTGILLFVTLLIISFDTWRGMLIFVASISLGLLCQQLNIPRHYLMGCLLLQVTVFFLQ